MKLSPCNTARTVIVGGGVAGLLLATRLGPRLARMRGRVTLVDHSWTHVWKPMLHTLAAGIGMSISSRSSTCARLGHALLYRRYQLALHGTARAALLWAAERINTLVQPKIRMT